MPYSCRLFAVSIWGEFWRYFPMQKDVKMDWRISGVVIWPVTEERW